MKTMVLALVSVASLSAQTFLIDDFSSGNFTTSGTSPVITTGTMLGGTRTLTYLPGVAGSASVSGGLLTIEKPTFAQSFTISYSGFDLNTTATPNISIQFLRDSFTFNGGTMGVTVTSPAGSVSTSFIFSTRGDNIVQLPSGYDKAHVTGLTFTPYDTPYSGGFGTAFIDKIEFTTMSSPEPSTFGLVVGAGLCGFAVLRARAVRRSALSKNT